jgi:crotonobetainyl-CoA:carnitine CoA-transferase CaiB-like acyl-CoA transferase
MTLGDLGADVIKVEHPLGGDETRRWGPPFVGDTAAYFFTANRSRRSVALDLKRPDDRDVALALADDCDIVLENFLPGTTERFGIDPAALLARNPRLVYCTISGYGTSSSKSAWPALDFVIQAHSGLMGVTGGEDGSPLKAGAPVADMATGLFATVGILAALAQARATGHGAHVEVALADACACLLANQAMNWLLGDVEPAPAGNTHPSIAPYQTFRARDRLIALAATSDRQFHRLCATIGRDELAGDPRFTTNQLRVVNRVALLEEITRALADEDAEIWVQRFNEAGVAAAPVNSVAQVFRDPDIVERLLVTVSDGDRETVQVRSPIRLDGRPLEPSAAPPALGAHDALIRAAAAPTEALSEL